MKGLGITSKQMSIIFLMVVIFVSLALSGYSFLVSNHSASFPVLKEGIDDGLEVNIEELVVTPNEYVADKESEKKGEKKEEKKGEKPIGWLSVMKSSLGMNEL